MDGEEDGWRKDWMGKEVDGRRWMWKEVDGEEGRWEKDEWGRRWMGGGRWLMFCSIYFNIFYLNENTHVIFEKLVKKIQYIWGERRTFLRSTKLTVHLG